MEILTDIKREEWDSFVMKSAGSQILQSWGWGEVKQTQGWEPIRLAVCERGEMIAAASILMRKLPYIRKSIFYAPRGPIIDFNNAEALNLLLSAIKDEAKKRNAITLKIDPEIDENNMKLREILEKLGFHKQKKQIQPRATLYLDLRKSMDELLSSFEEKTRYNIRLSLKKGVKVKELPDMAGVDVFYDIYRETSVRDNFLIHPKSYYQNILKILGTNVRIFAAYLEDEPIAAVFNLTFGKRIWYMYGASKSSHRNVMPNHAIHWEVIKKAKDEGYELYDLWGIPSRPVPSHPLYGVYRFKKGFNGKLIKYIGGLDLVYDPFYYFLFEKGLAWFKNIQSLIKKGKISNSLGE